MSMKRFVALLFSMPLLGACVSQSPLPSSDEGLFAPVGYEALSGWEQEDHASLLP